LKPFSVARSPVSLDDAGSEDAVKLTLKAMQLMPDLSGNFICGNKNNALIKRVI